jgi:hypothetical protein
VEPLEIRIEDAREGDLDLVKDSWRKSFKNSPLTAKWPAAAYAPFIAAHMDRVLPRCVIRVARPETWDEGVLGWVAAEQLPDVFVLHWAWCRDEFRRQRVLSRLVQSFEPRGQRVFTHLRPPFSDCLKRPSLGFTWSPDHASR